MKIGSLVLAPVSPSLTKDYDWPNMADIISVQPNSLDKSKWSFQENVWKNEAGEIYVPDNATDLKLRLLIAAHAGISGHRAVETTLLNLKTRFWWESRDEDVRSFVSSCLHCISTMSSEKVPRPCLLYTSPSPRDQRGSRMPSSA